MTKEEALHMVGGYATGTLTPEEKAALFQAALEHQDVFDALQQDQSLREILENPAFRAELLSATQQRLAWYQTWWTWAGLGAAVVATAVIVVTLREPKPAAVTETATQTMAPPPPAPAGAAAPAARMDSFRESRKIAEQFTATVVHEGSGIRIEVTPRVDGVIRLYRVNEQGHRTPVFPPEPGLAVNAGKTYRVPFEAIRPVRELRLVVAFVPAGAEHPQEREIRVAP